MWNNTRLPRPWRTWIVGLALSIAGASAQASLLSDEETTSGLKEALTRGAAKAVDALGRRDGFMGNTRVRIPMPEKMQRAEKLVRKMGGAKYADQLVETMNRAAETAVVEAKPILWQSIRQMTVKDGIEILRGPDDAATKYFRRTTSVPLTAKFRPVVEAATAKVGVARYYDRFASRASKFGLMDAKDADLDAYITEKALDGMFLLIADEEKAIRKDPVATGSAVIKKVFGSLFK